MQGNLQELKRDLGESGVLPPDEVSMPELDATLHGCKGGPVMGVPRDSLVYSARASCEGNSEVRPRMPGESEGTKVSTFLEIPKFLKTRIQELWTPNGP